MQIIKNTLLILLAGKKYLRFKFAFNFFIMSYKVSCIVQCNIPPILDGFLFCDIITLDNR